jgi:transposase
MSLYVPLSKGTHFHWSFQSDRRLSPTMRQTHVAGDKAFVDHSGKTVPIVDPLTGEVRTAELD